ncbi:unnamed protein product [Strongylus vulgaris]|uniref:Uncharacterized protein n=1 Tax=Strongylus vulgaris TaxID=40348 RepID=A0A3P7J1H1_STRVU|nr:unnamed protein product [Strongylus vulgaris]
MKGKADEAEQLKLFQRIWDTKCQDCRLCIQTGCKEEGKDVRLRKLDYHTTSPQNEILVPREDLKAMSEETK